jgi:hypothetical protein
MRICSYFKFYLIPCTRRICWVSFSTVSNNSVSFSELWECAKLPSYILETVQHINQSEKWNHSLHSANRAQFFRLHSQATLSKTCECTRWHWDLSRAFNNGTTLKLWSVVWTIGPITDQKHILIVLQLGNRNLFRVFAGHRNELQILIYKLDLIY